MTLGIYFAKKCTDKILENIALLQLKLSDPGNLVTFELSGKIVDAAAGGLGGISAFAGDYLKQNADVLIVEALGATGLEDTAQQAFNLANNILAASLMANNELTMFFVRKLAQNIILELRKKQEILAELSSQVTQLYNLLKILNQGNPIFDPFIAQLRRALAEVRSARTDLTLVRNTFSRRDLWLSRRFTSAKASLQRAQYLVAPVDANPALSKAVEGGDKIKSGLTDPLNNPLASSQQLSDGAMDVIKAGQIAASGLVENPPFPTTEQQLQVTLAIPKLSRDIISTSQGYFEQVVKINAMIQAFITSLNQIQSSLPAYFKRYILSLFDPLLQRVDNLTGEMANVLNGSPTAVNGPLGGFRPQPLTVTVQSFKWAMDLSLILENFKTIPEGALNSIAISQGAVAAYQQAVTALQRLDDIRIEGAVFRATDAQEQVGELESQLLILLLEANNAIVSSRVRSEVLGVARAVLKRLSITVSRDNQIATILDRFAKTPFELDDVISRIGEGIFQLFGDAGLDNAVDLLSTGNFNKFFKLNSRESTFVGAALASVALLKQCFPDLASREKLNQIEFELEKDQDLLNIQFSIDFDLAIFTNLQDCLRLNSLGDLFNLQEALCGILESSGVGKSLNRLRDLISF